MTAALSTRHLTVRTRFRGGTATLIVNGELDILTVPAMRRVLQEVLDQAHEHLVFDLTGVSFIDCASARVLVAASRALPGSRKAVIRRPGRAVRRVLELTGMSRWFQIDVPPAVRPLARTPRRHAQPRASFPVQVNPVPGR